MSYYFYDRRSPNRNIFFSKILFFLTLTCNKKNFGSKNWKSGFITLCRIRCRFQNCLCFYSSIDSFWLLFFWRFKKHILQERHILRIIRGFWCYKCILSKDNRFLYDISAFMLYFIFSINSIVFYEIIYNEVTASRDVTMTSRICSPIVMKFA